MKTPEETIQFLTNLLDRDLKAMDDAERHFDEAGYNAALAAHDRTIDIIAFIRGELDVHP